MLPQGVDRGENEDASSLGISYKANACRSGKMPVMRSEPRNIIDRASKIV